MRIKHLVLDRDVHERLKAKKRETGLTVKEIGNTALRAALRRQEREERILEALLKMGCITREDYEQAAALVAQELQGRRLLSIRDMGRVDPAGRVQGLTAGSWTGREVGRCPKGSWQILEAWGRDGRRQLTPLHGYSGVEAYGVLLAGRMRMVCGPRSRTLSAPHMLHIPAGHTCASAPLSTKTRLLIVFVPAVFSGQSPTGGGEAR